MSIGTAHVIRANARDLPLADDSVDLVVTSPPYFALRSYQDGGEHYAGQIGDEPTPTEFVDSLLEVTRECVRVLTPSGSLWVNLGDKYAGSPRNMPTHNGTDPRMATSKFSTRALSAGDEYVTTVRPKSLIGIPWRYALRCIDDLGLILRAEVIWSKPNGLPESVTDRVRRSHEQWFHFTLQPRYFSAVDEIREPHAPASLVRYRTGYTEATNKSGRRDQSGNVDYPDGMVEANPLGKLPGSVWTVPTEPLRVPDHLGVDHFAAFPTTWPKRIIQGWSPAGVCVECGEGRRPVSTSVTVFDKARDQAHAAEIAARGAAHGVMSGGTAKSTLNGTTTRTISGHVCACTPFHYEPNPSDPDRPALLVYDWHDWTPAPTTPGVVLDPFGGTGTTAMVAKALGRTGISVDMSADYCRLAEWRTNDRDQLAKVLGLSKSDPIHDDEQSLLDLIEGGAA